MERIYPINVTVYKTPKNYTTGLVYSEAELEEIAGYCIDTKRYYTVAYREEDLKITDESSNNEATSGHY